MKQLNLPPAVTQIGRIVGTGSGVTRTSIANLYFFDFVTFVALS
jgi:hypothetical protein